MEWKKVEKAVRDEHESKGFAGRFGAGLPRINDGSFLFLQHMISKMKPVEQGGSRVAIVFNGSPLFTGAAGSGESEIRRWIIENDWLEAIVALPDQLFYNTGISTYVWIVTNRKAPARRGKVQLIDARDLWQKMRKSLGEKRKELSADHIDEITKLYGDFDRRRPGQDPPQRVLRVPPHHRRTPAAAPLGDHRRHPAPRSRADKKLAKLQPDVIDTLVERLAEHTGAQPTPTARPSPRSSTRSCKSAGLAAPQAKAVWLDLAVQDPDAPVITNRKGEPEPDPDLRDQENVPLPAGAVTSGTSPTPPAGSPAPSTSTPSSTTSRPRSTPTSPTPGSTTPRPRSATRSRSPATSTSTSHPARSPRSTPRSSSSKPRSRTSSAR